jgi:hypothetical protein
VVFHGGPGQGILAQTIGIVFRRFWRTFLPMAKGNNSQKKEVKKKKKEKPKVAPGRKS